MKLNFAHTSLRSILFLLLGALPSSAISYRHDVAEQDYLDLAAPYDAVGRVAFGGAGTGTLVSTTQILTAAHVVDSNHDGTADLALTAFSFLMGTNVDSPTYTLNNVISIAIHPLWSTGGSSRYDMAVMTIGTPFLDIAPMLLSNLNPLGEQGTMIGYGLNGTGAAPFDNAFDGLRRAAHNTIDRVGSTVRTDFDNPDMTTTYSGTSTPLALEGTTAAGDSGGPLVVNFGDGDRIVGVLNGGFNPDGDYSEYGDVSVWAPVDSPDNVAFLTSLGIGTTAVPEPSVVSLLGLGLIFTASRRSRKS